MLQDRSKTFFSYAHQDSEFVLRLVNDLRAGGADVWLDQLDIAAGQRWDTEIGKALRSCSRHVIILSPDAVESPNVMDELNYALEHKKHIIPLLYRDCEIPYRLGRVQHIDFRADYPAALRNLSEVLSSNVRPAPVPLGNIVATAPRLPAQVTAVSGAAIKPARGPEAPGQGTASTAQQRGSQSVLPPPSLPRAGTRKYWLGAGALVVLALVIARIASMDDRHRPENGQVNSTISPTPIRNSSPATSATSEGPMQANSLFNLGKDYYQKKQYDKAIDALTQAIQLEPNGGDAFRWRGKAYAANGDKDSAVRDFTRALSLNSKDEFAYEDRCEALHGIGQYDQAIQDCNEALKLNPRDELAYHTRAMVYESQGDYDRAIQDYNQAIKLDGDSAPSYCGLGNIYFRKGDYDRAIQAYNVSIKLDSNLAEAYYGRGIAYHKKLDLDRAIQDYDQALKLKPELLGVYNTRGIAYEDKGQYQKALRDFEAILSRNPYDSKALQNRNRVAAKLQK